MRALYSDEDWADLQKGDVLSELVQTEGGDDKGRAMASGIIPASADRIWAVLTDWESYPGFMPNVEETKLRRREGDKAWIAQHLIVVWNDIRFSVVWDMTPRQGLARFSLDDHEPADIADTRGSWQLIPLEDGSQTLVRYESQTDVGRPVPAFILNALSKRSLPRVMRGLRDEVARRFEAP